MEGPDSLFEYYKSMVEGVTGFIYLYASTNTVYKVQDSMTSTITNMKKHAANKCFVGLLSAESELYKQLINAKLGPQN